ncbi:MAG: hypothetical protein Q4F56_01260 [Candidatus Saccharibacteria bacterium]|nr:hypothetical protein [Candidatus Saccharibacteria bacterium]
MKRVRNVLLASLIAILGAGALQAAVYADDNTEEADDAPKTSLTIMPVSRTLSISSDSTYDGSLSVTNDGTADTKVEVHVSPYSYVYSGEEDAYKLGFDTQNDFTQMSRWITIKDGEGNYTSNPTFVVKAGETLNVDYRITTPKNIPAGGQYAVIFVQTISGNVTASGIRTEASAGMIIYGRSTEGETLVSAEVKDMEIGQRTKNADEAEGANNNFYGTAKVKNSGNVDFFAKGILKVEPIIGFSSYTTPDTTVPISIIPESERVVGDEWAETPDFGIYKVTWTVTAGDKTEVIEKVIFLISPLAIIITIIVLTIIIMLAIIWVRRRKELRSRLAV